MGFLRRKDRSQDGVSSPSTATETAPPANDNAWNAEQIPAGEEEQPSLLETDAESAQNPIDVTPPPIASAEAATEPASAPAEGLTETAPAEGPAESAPEATAPAEAPVPVAGDTGPPVVDLVALDAEFKEIWRTTDRAGTDAWLEALPSRAPVDVHAEKAAEYSAWVTEKRVAADARKAEEEAAREEAAAPPEAIEVVEELPPELVAPTGDEEAEDDGWGLDDLAEIAQVALNPVTTVVGEAAKAFSDWLWGEEEETPETEAPEAGETPEEVPEAAPAAPAPDLDGKTDNLDAAVKFAEDTSPAHPRDGVADSVKKGDRKKAILAGTGDELATLMCSEFTAATLVEAGWNLADYFHDSATGLRVAYAEGTKDEKTTLYWVQQYDVINMYEEATHAVLEAQKGLCERIEPGTERAAEFHETISEPFLLGPNTTFVGQTASADDEFGAGLAAVAFGGKEVDPTERKPGDLQQRLDVANGKYTGGGHSSVVYEVQGTGVAYHGGSGSPDIIGDVGSPATKDELEAGWYEIPAGSKLRWAVTGDTAAEQVATLDAVDVRLVDSSNKRSDGDGGFDATAAGGKSHGESTGILSNGRLPTSKWFAWAPDSGQAPIAVLEPAAKKSSKKSG